MANKNLIAIGQVTAKTLLNLGLTPSLVAKEEHQEGLIHELSLLDWNDAYVLYPRSSISRPLLLQFFLQRGVRVQVCDLYDTVLQKLPVLDLSSFDEIVFTSPSTVEGFFQNYQTIPPGIRITTIGPITKSALGKIPSTLYDRM